MEFTEEAVLAVMPNRGTELERAHTISLPDSHPQKELLSLDGRQLFTCDQTHQA